jgi:hypothetical protein
MRQGRGQERLSNLLSTSAATQAVGSVEMGADETLVQLLPLYRVILQDPVALDVLAGGWWA